MGADSRIVTLKSINYQYCHVLILSSQTCQTIGWVKLGERMGVRSG